MAGWKKVFVSIGKAIAKQTVPGVIGMEEAIVGLKRGDEKRAAVMKLVENGLLAAGTLTGQDLMDPDLVEGIRLINDGHVKIMKFLQKRDSVK